MYFDTNATPFFVSFLFLVKNVPKNAPNKICIVIVPIPNNAPGSHAIKAFGIEGTITVYKIKAKAPKPKPAISPCINASFNGISLNSGFASFE